MKRGHKGISPLIATVLLVGFVIVLAALVFMWWDTVVKERAAKVSSESGGQLSCALELDFQIQESCYTIESDSSGVVSLSLENTGQIKIDGFKLKIHGKDSSGAEKDSVIMISEDIKEGRAKKTAAEYEDFALNDPSTTIEVYPVIRSKGAESVCQEKKQIINPIEACT